MYKFMKVMFWVLVFLLLAGCADVPAGGVSLQEQKEALRATQRALDARLQATEAARRATQDGMLAEAMQATLSAAHTEQAAQVVIERLAAEGTATQAAYSAQGQATATAVAALALARDQQISSDLEGAKAQATVQALEDATRMRRRQEDFSLFVQQAWRLAVLAAFAAMVLLLCWVIGVYVYARRHRWAALYRDPRGDAPLLPMGGMVLDMDLSAYPTVNPRTTVQEPVDLVTQMGMKDAQQKIKLAYALPRANQLDLGSGRFHLLGEGERPPVELVPDGGVAGILDAEWHDER